MIFREIIGSCQDNCLSLHPVAVMKHPDKYSVRQKAFSPACSSRLQSFTAEALTAGAGENWSHCVLHQEHRTKMTRPCQFLAHFLTCFSVLVLWGRVSPPPPPPRPLSTPGCPGTLYKDQAGLQITEIHLPLPQVLRFKVCTTIPGTSSVFIDRPKQGMAEPSFRLCTYVNKVIRTSTGRPTTYLHRPAHLT